MKHTIVPVLLIAALSGCNDDTTVTVNPQPEETLTCVIDPANPYEPDCPTPEQPQQDIEICTTNVCDIKYPDGTSPIVDVGIIEDEYYWHELEEHRDEDCGFTSVYTTHAFMNDANALGETDVDGHIVNVAVDAKHFQDNGLLKREREFNYFGDIKLHNTIRNQLELGYGAEATSTSHHKFYDYALNVDYYNEYYSVVIKQTDVKTGDVITVLCEGSDVLYCNNNSELNPREFTFDQDMLNQDNAYRAWSQVQVK